MPGELSHLEQVFTDALARATAAERAAFLDHACGGDADLRRRVEGLLRAHDAAAGMLPLPTVEHATDAGPAESLGQLIGPYRLVAVIGEVGFGTVYLAE